MLHGSVGVCALLAAVLLAVGAATARAVDLRGHDTDAYTSTTTASFGMGWTPSQPAGPAAVRLAPDLDDPIHSSRLGGGGGRSLRQLSGSGDSCRKMAPLECDFLYSETDTVLVTQGVLELSGFTGTCQPSCITYLTEAPECQAAPDVRETMLDVCRAYQCASRVTSACGPSQEGELLDHSLACSTECSSAVQSPECDGAEEILPGFGLYQQQIGAEGNGQECANYRCQGMLGLTCVTYDASAKNLLSSDMCSGGCYASLRDGDCMNAGIVIINVQGEPTALWDANAALSTEFGPASPSCTNGAPSFATGITAVFPDIAPEMLQADADLSEQFRSSFSSAVTVSLQILGLEPQSFALDVQQVSEAAGGGVEVLADIVFRSQAERTLLLSNAVAFQLYASLGFQTEGLVGEVTAVEGAAEFAGQQSSSGARPLVSRAQPEVTTAQSLLPEGDGGGTSAAVLALSVGICVAAGCLLALLVAIAATKRRRAQPEGDEQPAPPVVVEAAAGPRQVVVVDVDGWTDACFSSSGGPSSSRRLSSALGDLTLTTGTSADSVDSSAEKPSAEDRSETMSPMAMATATQETVSEEEVWVTPQSVTIPEGGLPYDTPRSSTSTVTPTSRRVLVPVPVAMEPDDLSDDDDMYWVAPPLNLSGMSEPELEPEWDLAMSPDSQREALPSP